LFKEILELLEKSDKYILIRKVASYTKPHYINVYNNKTADTFTLHSDLDVVFSNFGKISYEDFYYQLLMEESPIETQKVDKKR